jgi:hypothetical protein
VAATKWDSGTWVEQAVSILTGKRETAKDLNLVSCLAAGIQVSDFVIALSHLAEQRWRRRYYRNPNWKRETANDLNLVSYQAGDRRQTLYCI